MDEMENTTSPPVESEMTELFEDQVDENLNPFPVELETGDDKQ